MDKESEPASSAGPVPLDQVRHSVHSDLQYVSLQVDGKTYGGWYRVLADGQMELLALANMHCERRHENTAIEQARGMLEDFVRAARQKSKTNDSTGLDANLTTGADDGGRDSTTGTLGDLLYADKTKPRVSEKDWVGLVESIAAGDQLALRGLYQRTHRVVFTLLMRLTNDPESAEELTLGVFHDVWRLAPEYDAAAGSVVGWIMNQARSRAIDRLRFEEGKSRVNAHASSRLPMNAASDCDEMESFVYWPSDVLRPLERLWERLAQRIAAETGDEPVLRAMQPWTEPEWEEAAPGISCKLLATDSENDRVSMLVRLAPGIDYPPHRHAGIEELHLLHGELWIDDRKLYPGDYNRAEPGTADKRVWSETGCTCVLVTSTRDALG